MLAYLPKYEDLPTLPYRNLPWRMIVLFTYTAWSYSQNLVFSFDGVTWQGLLETAVQVTLVVDLTVQLLDGKKMKPVAAAKKLVRQ